MGSNRGAAKHVGRQDVLHKCHGDVQSHWRNCWQQSMLLPKQLVPSLRSEEVVLTNLEDPVWPWAIEDKNSTCKPGQAESTDHKNPYNAPVALVPQSLHIMYNDIECIKKKSNKDMSDIKKKKKKKRGEKKKKKKKKKKS